MAGNTFGTLYKLTSFGESHGRGVGGIIEGVAPGLELDADFIQQELDRRRPGQSAITTPRDESDRVEFISGVMDGKATGTPLAFVIWNKDQKSGDYDNLKDIYRPSHADYTYQSKYGIRDHRGGGRSSARETIARVVAGAVAKLMLNKLGVSVQAYVSQVGTIRLDKMHTDMDLSVAESNIVRCPDPEIAKMMIEKIDETRKAHDSIGGVVSCIIKNAPAGLGDPVFDKLHARLGQAMLSINAVKGFEYGSGFNAVEMLGSAHNDEFYTSDGKVRSRTNRSGGIQGGISNGEEIYFRVAFKPVATILKDQKTVDKEGNEIVMKARGRHDPCVVPRAVPIVEAMAAMVLTDALLINKSYL
ncbi:chorismate synthase [Alkalitalea saponilacus]|uniref:Chorismate synthase n=1 Tax=Alkalitalea saponilacus TaxID=889453 RepID=A0A1T5H332_9BACT|nr:chorismate synthase [Alkalitalea saponilacus]ASB50909.1 chorismate synthase [Alkalitalea saponilacus]SKC15021.1 chorismate synthase [Alkalitalea saponilacus]